MGPLCPCPNSKKPMKKGTRGISWGPLLPPGPRPVSKWSVRWCLYPEKASDVQGRTDNSWGPRAIGDHGAPVSLPKLKKAYEKGTKGISWGPLLTPGSA
ncbi:unnamed protein product [Staurois parvus]|uniref:Uncharacterized protein n=1 Tax=Staurois parvus TaxID=386267 RepID=A0ABN9GMS8_9NEOB|nr:unnamed protein product [Staurois parvus]